MAVEWQSVQRHPDRDDIVIFSGIDSSKPILEQQYFHHLHLVAFEWRAVEFGVDPKDTDLLFKMLFAEMLDIWTPEIDSDESPNPWQDPPEVALPKKLAFIERVSQTHGGKLRKQRARVALDRVDLGLSVKKMLPGGDAAGIGYESKRLMSRAVHGPQDRESLMEVQEAQTFMQMGVVNNADAALVAGYYEVQSKIAESKDKTTDELIAEYNAQLEAGADVDSADQASRGGSQSDSAGDAGSAGV